MAEDTVQRLHRVIAESLPYIDFAARFDQAEAAIQRVRDVCADESFWAEGGPGAKLVRAVTVEAIFAALDGAS